MVAFFRGSTVSSSCFFMDFYGHLAFCRGSAVSSSYSWGFVLTWQGSGLHLVRAVCGDAPLLHQQHLPAGVHDHQRPCQVAQEHEPSLQGFPAGAAQQESPPASVLARPSLPPLRGLCSQRYQSLSHTFSHGCEYLLVWKQEAKFQPAKLVSAYPLHHWSSTDCVVQFPQCQKQMLSCWVSFIQPFDSGSAQPLQSSVVVHSLWNPLW